MTIKVAIAASDPILYERAKSLAKELQLPLIDCHETSFDYVLMITPKRIELRQNKKTNVSPIFVDFLSGKIAHRLKYGGGKKQLIARAVGVAKKKHLTVLDVTAGLGQDGIVLASLGCQVTLIERSPIIGALLEDGLSRAMKNKMMQNYKINLLKVDGIAYLSTLAKEHCPEIIYLDPMFPSSKKTALVKKEMRILREIVGEDIDASQLFLWALKKAKKRVVVKRSRLAPYLNNKEPDRIVKGSRNRYDIYDISRHC